MKWNFWQFFTIILVGLSLSAYADRTITIIPNDGSALKISNPSTVAQSFSMSCKDSDGTEIASFNINNLPSNQTTIFTGSSVACRYIGASPTPTPINSSGMTECNANSMYNYASFDDAHSGCADGYRMCTLDEWEVHVSATPAPYIPASNAWISVNQNFDATDSYNPTGTPDPWATPAVFSLNNDYTAYQPSTNYTSSYACRKTDTGSGSPGSDATYCSKNPRNSITIMKVMCCPSANLHIVNSNSKPSMCTINVQGNDGFLVTPAFKGGTPF